MTNFENHARHELELAGFFNKDGMYGDMMGHAVMKMIRQFGEENHSGMSASIAISVFERLARYEPLTPLTGEDDEWTEVSEGVLQNKRCSHVFKTKEKGAYDINGKVFEDERGCRYTNAESRVPVTFPYTPKTEVIKRSNGVS